MFDLKVLRATLEQLETEKHIPRKKILEAIEQAMAAAYKRDYGRRGQIIHSVFNLETGTVEFSQVKTVVDATTVRPQLAEGEEDVEVEVAEGEEERPRFDPEKHLWLEDAKKIKAGVTLGEEIVFPLEPEEDFGRIAAQTAKQVIIQRIREAEKGAILEEYADKRGTVINGTVQKVDRGNILVDFDRVTGIIPREEQIPGEFYRTGQRLKAFLYAVEETPRGVSLKLSRSHPRFIEELFSLESPEVASGTVEIKSIAREPGSRSKIAVVSYDANIDPIGACVGQKGIRVMTVKSELSGENIDIIPWAEDALDFVANALAPARVIDVEIDEDEHIAHIDVAEDQLSLAIGKGGQNVRLAAKLTGWKIDIRGVEMGDGAVVSPEEALAANEEPATATKDATELTDLVTKATTEETPAVDEESVETTNTEEEAV